ncbi:amidase [Pseudolabrys sp. FHR47]|uniref:amidase n=1 Tax=Pseudolabrys sp. FHR47 TaxID=2562284 RepID=UPI0010BF4ED7|nr:amidase [Pseudolabrys sp. FHR47]
MTDEELTGLTAIEAAEHIANGDFSSEEYVGACLDRIAAIDGEVRAFVHLDPDAALAQAREVDERRRNGLSIGLLHGLPVAIKDLFDTADYKTEYGTALFRGRQPTRDSAVVARLREAGAVIIGKTVTTELAYFSPGPTRNPHDLTRTPGGSSSGSAAAVAAAMVPLAVGSQTNGSMIRPASFCGVYGVKPTHGLISRHGALELSRSLDHVGVFARSLADAALILEVLAGYDPNDPDTKPVAAPDFLGLVAEEPPLPPRLAFVRTPVWDKADAQAHAAFEELVAALGDRIVEVALPDAYAVAWDDQRVIMAADMAHNFDPLLKRGGDVLSQQMRDLLADGRAVPAVRYLDAQRNARGYAAGLMKVFDEYDAILTPATPGVAPVGEATGSPVFNSLWSLTGLPALTLPLLSGEGGMPLGVQLVGAKGDDARLLRTANWLVEQLEE